LLSQQRVLSEKQAPFRARTRVLRSLTPDWLRGDRSEKTSVSAGPLVA